MQAPFCVLQRASFTVSRSRLLIFRIFFWLDHLPLTPQYYLCPPHMSKNNNPSQPVFLWMIKSNKSKNYNSSIRICPKSTLAILLRILFLPFYLQGPYPVFFCLSCYGHAGWRGAKVYSAFCLFLNRLVSADVLCDNSLPPNAKACPRRPLGRRDAYSAGLP